MDPFAVDTEWFAAGGEDLHPLRGLQKRLGKFRSWSTICSQLSRTTRQSRECTLEEPVPARLGSEIHL